MRTRKPTLADEIRFKQQEVATLRMRVEQIQGEVKKCKTPEEVTALEKEILALKGREQRIKQECKKFYAPATMGA